MKTNGAVICFQKYALGNAAHSNTSIAKSPICLGYFGRVEVKEVKRFKDYVKIASRHGANQACSRKQLMLYQIDSDFDKDISIADQEYRDNGGVPFWHSENEPVGLCCCTALNVTTGILNNKNSLKTVAKWLYDALNDLKAKAKGKFAFAITGLLDAEDICLITLSDRYDEISSAIQSVLQLHIPDKSIPLVDNSHSILIMDTTGNAKIDPSGWDNTYADIHFSLKSAAGRSYLQQVEQRLKDKLPGELRSSVILRGQTGEYDAFIRCPAMLLDCEMYGDNGLISYSNKAYREAAYQSETNVYPFGGEECPSTFTNVHPDEDLSDNLSEKVECAIEQIKEFFLGDKKTEDNDFDYIELAIYRLLKDYRRMSAYPYNGSLRKDFAEQFTATVNAVVEAARKCKECNMADSISLFNEEFDEIVNALSQSLQAASQFDRLNFDEQPHYLQNIGSYHKILRCYYGIIKDILKLLYAIDRKENSEQSVLIPLLSFGLTPIVVSNKYSSTYEFEGRKKEACLISIKLPYQAIANPPKYLGILVHELFHYAAPSDREYRNRVVITLIARAALMEFIRVIADGQKLGFAKHYGLDFCTKFRDCCEYAADVWADQVLKNDYVRFGQSDVLRDQGLAYFKLKRDPDSMSYRIYFNLWNNLRDQLLTTPFECGPAERKIFALDIEEDGDVALVKKAFERRINAIKPEMLADFDVLLSDFLRATGELPPDLFDVGFTLHNESSDKKLSQYLWQIHGTQRDLFAGAMQTVDVDSSIISRLGITALRMGFFIDYYLQELDQPLNSESLPGILENWGGKKEKFQHIKKQFALDYAAYNELSGFFSDVSMKLSESIIAQINTVSKKSEYSKIINRLTRLYGKYYKLLDKLQNEQITEDFFENEMFKLCCTLVDEYQNQPTLQEICSIATTIKKRRVAESTTPTVVARVPKYLYETTAEDSAALSRSIHTAYKAMSANGKLPVLWYRGQRNKTWGSLPNIMRGKEFEDSCFIRKLQREMRWAKAKILPVGNDFTPADWLAFLQHNGFKTSVLDFSESLYPALFFATEKWDEKNIPEIDASITMFNPVLFNLAMKWLDKIGKTVPKDLEYYLENGEQEDDDKDIQLPLFANDNINDINYTKYYNWNDNSDRTPSKPIAALIPKNCERMQKQSGQFVFYDLMSNTQADSDGKYNFKHWSLESLHNIYIEELKKKGWNTPIPFMYKINIGHLAYRDFKDYLQAIGMGKYQVYPEFDKLAEDIKKQLKME